MLDLLFVKNMVAGFRPINTLTKTDHSRQPHDKKQKPPTLSEDGQSQFLHLETIRGNNVRQPPLGTNEDDISEVPPAKRRKMEPKASKLDSSSVSSDAGIDPFIVGDEPVVLLARDSPKPSQTRSGHGQGHLINYPGSAVNGHVPEYQKLEAIMRSDPSRSNKIARENGHPWGERLSDSKSAGLAIAGAPTIPDLIDLCDDENHEKTHHDISFEGTEQSIKNHSDLMHKKTTHGELPQLQPQSTATQSRHFANTISIERAKNTPHTPLPSSTTSSQIHKEEPRLNDQFRAMDGKRRNTEYSSSPDELAGDPPPKLDQASLLPKPILRGTDSRMASPTKSSSSTRKGSPTVQSPGGLAPSSVPISTFVRRGRDNVESEPSWGAALATVNVGGRMLCSSGLGLQLNPKTDSYEIIDSAEKVLKDGVTLQIQPRKLLRVTWSTSRPQVRFFSSKSVNCDPTLDLELRSAKKCQDLLSRLQNECSHSLRVESKDGQVGPREDSLG